MKFSKEILIILIIQITEVLGFSLILPFLPVYAQEMGATPLEIGLILTSFSFFQFFSAPIMGKLSDRYGRKPLLILSQISTMIGFIVLAYSTSISMIFLSRAIDGILGSNFTIAQACLSDLSTKKDRSKVFGISGIAFGFGFLIGPAIGGYLGQFGLMYPSLLAAAVSLITIFLTFFLLPETVKEKDRTKKLDIKIIDIKLLTKYFSNKKISPKLVHFFSYVLAHVIWTSTFSLYAVKQLGMNTFEIGLALAGVGLISIIIRGILLPKLIDVVGETKLLISGLALFTISLFLSAFVTQIWMFASLLILFSLGSGLARPLLTGAISRSASENEQGSILGVSSSLGSMAQILGPLIGGYLLNNFFSGSLGIVASLVMGVGLLLVIKDYQQKDLSIAK